MQGKTTAKPVLVSGCSGVRECLYICKEDILHGCGGHSSEICEIRQLKPAITGCVCPQYSRISSRILFCRVWNGNERFAQRIVSQ